MLDAPFDGFFADRYLMDFYDVIDRDICSRIHLHTGLRFVRMMTGPGTRIRVSSLSPIDVTHIEGVTPFRPEVFEDATSDAPDGVHRTRYNLVVPENSWADMQIPRGVSHQFNAHGPHAVIDSVHPRGVHRDVPRAHQRLQDDGPDDIPRQGTAGLRSLQARLSRPARR
ncbi:hypothetical protein [Streptomyces platensis]|uniref:hypothetical protein n=1 Tax=Streptomyces platensis TaxID=58346 RepID=UPI0037AD1ED0